MTRDQLKLVVRGARAAVDSYTLPLEEGLWVAGHAIVASQVEVGLLQHTLHQELLTRTGKFFSHREIAAIIRAVREHMSHEVIR